MHHTFPINVNSEIGKLNGVILHRPGSEIENMTPENAERALYSDLLNLSVAGREYAQLSGVLEKVTKAFYVKELLTETLINDKVRDSLIDKVCLNEKLEFLSDFLHRQAPEALAASLIEGVLLKKNTLTRYLSKEQFALRPLHNFFFTRDGSISINQKVLIGKMASQVRERESLIMESIFDYHPMFQSKTINPIDCPDYCPEVTIEGGDVLVARHDVLLIGIGARTTAQGVDFILKRFKDAKKTKHIIIQELPRNPESFIHLDMVFTILDFDTCMVYEPLILKQNKYHTVHIKIDNGQVEFIKNEKNLLEALESVGISLKPTFCGGRTDQRVQEREQWHSGANFFAFEPGKVIGYGRNVHTMEELNNNGFEIIKAVDVMKGKVDLAAVKRCVVTIEGAELSRGGGGARCMTMPINRTDL
ncbi:MAG TPA: arginine deiminase [Bacteroidales bacterium]|nr:arginine deiminase [Bacteroidales bacterium]